MAGGPRISVGSVTACLDRLELGREREAWKTRFDRYSAEFEPVIGHQDGPPEG